MEGKHSHMKVLENGLQIRGTFLNGNVRDWVTEQKWKCHIKYLVDIRDWTF